MSPGLRSRTLVWLILTAVAAAAVLAVIAFASGDRLSDLRPLIAAASSFALVFLIIGWLVLYAPLSRRLDRLVGAAEQLAEQESPEPIDDRVPDEVGDASRAVDRIAAARGDDRRATVELGERFRHLTTHDALTGVLNRQTAAADLTRLLASTHHQTVSVVSVDIDDFRLVNELFGHAVGDEILVAAANRLRRLVGDDAAVGRWGADEFLLILADVDPADLATLSGRVTDLFEEPINTAVGPHPIACSVGSASAMAGKGTIDELLADADVTVQAEKLAHRRVRSIRPETAQLVELALRDDRLEIWYQPVVQLNSPSETRMVGAEAFVRLRTDDDELLVPSDFMGEIMTSRYAREVDLRVAKLLLADLAIWDRQGQIGPDFFVSLNLSPASLRDDELGRTLLELCHRQGVAPQRIVLDVSEEAAEIDQITAAELRQYGFRLSIDDLGLKRSNFDRLFSVGAEFAKLHRRWLDDEIMLDALVTICQRKGLHVVAEGVETMGQLELLFERGVRLVQGYVVSRPIASSEFAALLGVGRPSNAPT
ncbi:MAG: GGDEF and EAL domain-containing protein [Actinomycetota bacterium]